MFLDQESEFEWKRFMGAWVDGPGGVRRSFRRLNDAVSGRENAVLEFVSRPGVSYSLRGLAGGSPTRDGPIFTLIDVIDDDPGHRWLSVCFYEEAITDPEGLGNLVPQGILGRDGHCFDVTEFDEGFLAYLEERIREAHAWSAGRGRGTER